MPTRYSYATHPSSIQSVKGKLLADLSKEARETAVPFDLVRFIDSGHLTKADDLKVVSKYISQASKLTTLPDYRAIAPVQSLLFRDATSYPITEGRKISSGDEESTQDPQLQHDLAKLSDIARRIAIPYDLQEFIDTDPRSGAARWEMSLQDYQLVKNFLAQAKEVTRLRSYRKMKLVAHCIRCHRNYNAFNGQNKHGACEIAHIFDYSKPKVMRVQDEFAMANFNARRSSAYSRSLGGYTKTINVYESLCCGPSVALKEDGSKNFTNIAEIGPCFRGRHTTNVEDMDDVLSGPYNGHNIVECQPDGVGVGLLGFGCKNKVLEDDPILIGEKLRTTRRGTLPSPSGLSMYASSTMQMNSKHW